MRFVKFLRNKLKYNSSIFSNNIKQFWLNATNLMVAAAGIRALWLGLERLLATNRGLDLTDEGLYLLAADPPTPYANYGFPFGWHTGVLFRLVRLNIADFRTAGAVLLVLAGILCGWLAVKIAQEFSRNSVTSTVGKIWGAAVGGIGTLLYYASLLVTPSYNWLNLFGMLLAVSGYLQIILSYKIKNPFSLRLSVCRIPWLAAIGLFVTLPAKPSTAPLLWLAGLFLLSSTLTLRHGLQISVCIGLLMAGLVGVAVAIGLWQWPFHPFFMENLKVPKYSDGHAISQVFKDIALVPALFLGNIYELPKAYQSYLGIGFLLLVAGSFLQKKIKSLSAIFIFLSQAAICCLSLILAKATLGVFGPSQPIQRLGYQDTVTACLIMFAVAMIGYFLDANLCKKQEKAGDYKFAAIPAVLFLVSASFIFAFGTNNGAYRLAGLSGVFLLLAILILISSFNHSEIKKIYLASLLFFVAMLTASTIWDSRQKPYRGLPIADQREMTFVGKQRSKLFLDNKKSDSLKKLLTEAQVAGWENDTPLFGVVWRWASTVPYFLGARVPDCLIITLFSYENSVEVARYKIDRLQKSFPGNQAWILTNDPQKLKAEELSEVNEVLKMLEKKTNAKFPEQYELVARGYELHLWKPIAK